MTLQKRRRYINNFKTLLSLKRSVIKHIKTYDNDEIVTDLSDNDFIRKIFSEDKHVTLKVRIRLKI